jgi:hypothetical protein
MMKVFSFVLTLLPFGIDHGLTTHTPALSTPIVLFSHTYVILPFGIR